MKTPSRSLAGLKRLAGVGLLLFLFVGPRAFAQVIGPPFELKVVGDNTPIDTGQYCGKTTSQFADCFLAQAFSLSSGAYVNQVKLTLIGFPTSPDFSTALFSVMIVGSLIDDCPGLPVCGVGQVQLELDESVVVPRSPAADQLIPFAISFPQIYLPKGTYYLVFTTAAPIFTELTWAANQVVSSEAGILGQAFCTNGAPQCGSWNWVPLTTNPTQPANLAGSNGTFAFELDGPLLLPPTGGGLGQVLRLVAGPVTPAPGVPVEAQLGFVDLNGNPIGPSSTATIGPGQIQSLDLNLSQFVTQLGQHIEVVPVVALPPNASGAPSAAVQLSVTTQILDALTGFETMLTPALQPGSSAPALAPQVLAGGQTMRISVTASNTDPCNATLSFVDKDGVVLGPSESVSVSPGTGTSLDLNGNTLGLTLGRRIEVLPIVTPAAVASPGALPVNSVCQVTVEVFDHLTGRTSSSQSTSTALPAVQ